MSEEHPVNARLEEIFDGFARELAGALNMELTSEFKARVRSAVRAPLGRMEQSLEGILRTGLDIAYTSLKQYEQDRSSRAEQPPAPPTA